MPDLLVAAGVFKKTGAMIPDHAQSGMMAGTVRCSLVWHTVCGLPVTKTEKGVDIMRHSVSIIFVAMAVVAAGSTTSAYNVTDNIYVEYKEEFRSETWDTFDNGAPDRDTDYTFMSSKMRLGFGFNNRLIDAFAQFQWTQLINLPDNAVSGTGALYYAQNNDGRNVGYACLSQGWIRARVPGHEGFSLRLGRFPYSSGLEPNTLSKNKTLQWLRRLRISRRLIGPFEWTRIGRSYDGIQAAYNSKSWNLTVTAMHPTPGGFYLKRDDAHENGYSSNDIDMVAAAVTIKDSVIQGFDAQAFYYYYNDYRGLYKDRKGDEIEVNNLGGHLLYNTPRIGPGSFDFLVWGDYQTGTYSSACNGHRLDHSAYAVAIEGGYQFSDIAWKP